MLVGKHMRKVQRGGWLRFPKEWLPFLDGSRAVVAMPNPKKGKSVLLVPLDDFNREQERKRSKDVPSNPTEPFANRVQGLAITADGRVKIPVGLLAYAGIKDVAELTGVVRMIVLKCLKKGKTK